MIFEHGVAPTRLRSYREEVLSIQDEQVMDAVVACPASDARRHDEEHCPTYLVALVELPHLADAVVHINLCHKLSSGSPSQHMYVV